MTERATHGIGLMQLLTVLFIGLKLTNYIDWSWWWVFAPLWIPLAVVFGWFAIVALIFLLCALADSR